MNLSVRASRVVIFGFDPLAGFTVLLSCQVGVPVLMALTGRALGVGLGWAFLLGLLEYGVAIAGCRYRLVVDAKGSRLIRSWLGIPWSRRPYGRRPAVHTLVGFDGDELVLVPEHPRDGEDRFIALDIPGCGWTLDDLDACADVADREIERVTTPPRVVVETPYRSPPRG